MQIIVRQEAGPAHDGLGRRLEDIAAATVPLVTAVTELPLPERLVIRTMTVTDWKKAHRQSSKAMLVADTLRYPSGPRLKARLARRFRLAFMMHMWPAMLGEAKALHDPASPELIMLPEALEHAGRLDDAAVLHKTVAHETTHIAQDAASGGTLWAAQDCFFPVQAGTAGRNYAALVEGHAYWADSQITSKLFGAAISTDTPSPDASADYLKIFSSPARTKAVEVQRQATHAVAGIIDRVGVSAFNRVWADPDLVPLTSETASPESWESWGERLR
ncbi:zinc-dependent metalloprotease [Streptomyces griseoviridis]|uniref:zinc-dependent metalloprotease n=1 Tax=Streptomyces griseoviridis TaxID=45398 RepID=UPI0033DF0600